MFVSVFSTATILRLIVFLKAFNVSKSIGDAIDSKPEKITFLKLSGIQDILDFTDSYTIDKKYNET